MRELSMIASLAATLVLIIMAVFVIYKDRTSQINRYYFTYNIFAIGILSTMFLTYSGFDTEHLALINRITQSSTVLFFASFLSLSLVFPKEEKRFPLSRTLLIMTPGVIIAGIAAGTDLTITRAWFEGENLMREFRPMYSVYAAVAFTYLLAGSVNFVRKYMKTSVYIYKLQMRYLFLGTSIALMAASVCSIILPRFYGYSGLYVLGPSLASFIATFFLFYSVISYNLMDITTAIHKTSMYSVITMLVIIPLYGATLLLEPGLLPVPALPVYVVAGIIVIFFLIFSRYIQPLIDRLFKRRQYAFENIIDSFIKEMEDIKDLNSIINRTAVILRNTLDLRHCVFYMLDDTTRRYEPAAVSGSDVMPPVNRTDAVIRWFLQNTGLMTMDRVYTDENPMINEIRSDLAGFFADNRYRVVLPIYHYRRLAGIICLGEKESLSGFSPAELERLDYFQKKCNVFVSAAMNYRTAINEQLISRTIELSSEIMDRSVPSGLPNTEKIRFGGFLIPKYEKGSDYFDFVLNGKNGIGIIAADVSGLGINSAFYNVMLRSAFRAAALEAPAAPELMTALNRVLFEYSGGSGVLVTAFYFYLDFSSMRLFYSNAGYPALELFRIEKNSFDSLDTEGVPLGFDSSFKFGGGRTNLIKGDVGIIYSKSLINSKNRDGEQFGLLRLRSIVSENRSRSAHEISLRIRREYEKFMGIETPDSDLIVLVFRPV
jgi:hypothetical protein